jgi:hypothetical protein
VQARGLDNALDVPGAHPALQEVGQDWFEFLADLLVSPPAISDDDPDRIVTRPRQAEFLGVATDATPCLGDRTVSIVEAHGRLAKAAIEPRRHGGHKGMLTEGVASVRLGTSRKSAKSSTARHLVTIGYKDWLTRRAAAL